MQEICQKCNKHHLILIKCKCNKQFCIKHQSPHKHKCIFNHSLENRCKLIENNPSIIKEKINKI